MTWPRPHRVVYAATLAVLAALPWTVSHWPSQDGPNHLAVVHVLLHYGDPGSPFERYLEVERGFRPSTACYAILAWLGRSMSLGSAEKVLVTAAVLLVPASLLLLVRRAVPGRTQNVLLAFPFVVGWALAMGFLSYVLAMGLGVTTLALAWELPTAPRNERGVGWRHGLAAATLFLCVWFHPAAAATTGLALLLLEWRALLSPRAWPRVLVVAAPAVVFLAVSYVAARAASAVSAVPQETKFANPLELLGGLAEYHLGYTPWELAPRVLALALLVRFAWRGVRRHSVLGSTPEGALGRLVLAFLLLYCATPVAFRGWFYASTRFLLFASLLLPAVAEIPPRVGRRLLVVAPVLTAAVLALQWPEIHRASREMREVLDVGTSIARGAKVVPMDFGARLLGPQPLAHAWAELVLERDAIAPQLFAVGKPRFGGEAFRTLAFRPEAIDRETGSLPWPGGEGWYDVVRKCSGHPWLAALVAAPGDCAALLAEREAALDPALDRYDYVLMLDPPDYAQTLLGSRGELVTREGSAWLFRVDHQGQGRSYSRNH